MARSLKDRILTPVVAKAMLAPTTILATGAGASAGILATGSVFGAIAGAVLGWLIPVGISLPKDDKAERIDPFTLDEPWRSLVRDALSARSQFADAVRRARTGPLADRLGSIGADVEAGVHEAWRIAQAGHSLSDGYQRLDSSQAAARLSQLNQLEAQRPLNDTQLATREAAEAELGAAQRMSDAISQAHDKLQLLNARLDEAVTRCIELSVGTAQPDDLSDVASDVSSITSELEALRQAVAATNQPQPGNG